MTREEQKPQALSTETRPAPAEEPERATDLPRVQDFNNPWRQVDDQFQLNAPTPQKSSTSVPYTGGPISPGAVVEYRARRELVIPGVLLLGVGYLSSDAVSMAALLTHNEASPLSSDPGCFTPHMLGFVPVIGAFASGTLRAVTNQCYGPFKSDTSAFVFGAISSSMQATGLTLLIVSLVKREAVLVLPETAAAEPKWEVQPGTNATPSGLTLAGHF